MFSLSRGILRSSGLILVSMAFARPGMVAADPPGCGCPPAPCAPCPTCCNCACCPQPPDICTCTHYKPVVDTCYRQQPYTAYRDVCKTCYRKEPYCVTVPVQKVDCVTCDEGCYKMVWCPKIVTKQIPRTEYHQQTCCRTVPYTVSERIPYTAMTVIPECRVRYCPETHTFLKPVCPCPPPCCPAPCCPAPVAPGCGSPVPMTSQAVPGGFAPQTMVSSSPGAPIPDQGTAYSVPQPVAAPTNMVVSNGGNDSYLRARSAANVWQHNRGLAQ